MTVWRILVTGGAGFIGSHLCDRLIADGHEVLAMDNLVTGAESNLAGLADHPRFRLVRHNVTGYITVEGPLDYVLHFASPASPVDYLRLPIQTLKVGALGTHNALGVAKKTGARFLLASTSEVYGDPQVHPQREDYWGHVNPVGPRGVYDEAKRFAESLTLAYYRTHGLDVRIVRIFNTYGPRMRRNDGRAIPNFIDQALQAQPITVYGTGEQTRSFCYISDLIEGLARLMRAEVHEPVNLGSPEERTIKALAEEIVRLTGSRSRIEYRPLPQDDPTVRQPDIGKAARLLRWAPTVPLDEGLRRTIEWFKSHDAQAPQPVPQR